jgi:hypothetical protein
VEGCRLNYKKFAYGPFYFLKINRFEQLSCHIRAAMDVAALIDPTKLGQSQQALNALLGAYTADAVGDARAIAAYARQAPDVSFALICIIHNFLRRSAYQHALLLIQELAAVTARPLVVVVLGLFRLLVSDIVRGDNGAALPAGWLVRRMTSPADCMIAFSYLARETQGLPRAVPAVRFFVRSVNIRYADRAHTHDGAPMPDSSLALLALELNVPPEQIGSDSVAAIVTLCRSVDGAARSAAAPVAAPAAAPAARGIKRPGASAAPAAKKQRL